MSIVYDTKAIAEALRKLRGEPPKSDEPDPYANFPKLVCMTCGGSGIDPTTLNTCPCQFGAPPPPPISPVVVCQLCNGTGRLSIHGNSHPCVCVKPCGVCSNLGFLRNPVNGKKTPCTVCKAIAQNSSPSP